MFFTHFIIGLLVSSFSVIVILLIRKWFGGQLTAKWNYHLWMFLFMALALPFIPNDLFNFSSHFSSVGIYQNAPSSSVDITGSDLAQGLHLIQDFSVSVNRPDLSLLNIGVMVIWMLGMLLFTFTIVPGWLTLRRIKKYSSAFSNQEVLVLFEECKKSLQIKRSIKIIISKRVQSPMIFGLFQTYIVLPSQHENWLGLKNYEYIFLHELNHYKNKDLLTNYVMLFYQIIYWFNPLVWLAFREMRLDREIACDTSVLQLLDDDNSFNEYGNTIINFLDLSKRSGKLQLVTQLNGSTLQIKKRIEQISAYKHSGKKSIRKSIFIYVLAGIILAIQLPFVSAFSAENDRYYFSDERAVYEDLHQFFKGYEGSFVLYNRNDQKYSIYNEEKSTLRVSPDSTYKIYSALFALESNVISPEETTLLWNGTEQPYDAWNMDQNVSSALQKSVSWYFQELDRRTGFETIQSNLQEINYGNFDVSGEFGEFWHESSLKISPVEQVQLLQAFYNNQLGYKEMNIQAVKEALLIEKSEETRLSGKTGTGTVNGKNINGWFIGYVETKDNTYFFATNIQNEDHSSGSKAGEITLSILKDLGIYEKNGGQIYGEKHS